MFFILKDEPYSCESPKISNNFHSSFIDSEEN